MNVAEWELLVLRYCCAFTVFALNCLLQSTVLIALGLCAGRLLQGKGAAIQSAIYKTTLAAVLVCPIASVELSIIGLDVWSIDSPVGFFYDEVVTLKLDPPVPQISNSFPSALGRELASDLKILRSENDNVLPSNEINSSIAPSLRDSESRANIGPTNALYPPSIPVEQAGRAPVRLNEIRNLAIHRFGIVSIFVTVAWVLVASVKALRLVSSVIAMNRLRSQAIFASADAIKICKRIASEMGVHAPQVLLAPFITSPFLHGIRRPAIIIPDHPDFSLNDVFVHELAHLRRSDCLWLLLRHIATTALFFQPLLWWLARRIDVTSEEVCDDCVVEYGRNRESYATSLVDIAALSIVPSLSSAVVGMISVRSMLGRRVARILDTDRLLSTRISNFVRTSIIGTGLLAAAIVGLIGLSISYPTATTSVFSQEKNNEAAPTTKLAAESISQSLGNGQLQPMEQKTVDITFEDRISNDLKKPDSNTAIVKNKLEKHILHGTVLDPDGKPAVKARVVAISHKPSLTSGPRIDWTDGYSYGELKDLGETVTDEAGAFSMTVLVEAPLRISVSAFKDGFAADEKSMWSLAIDEPWNLRLAATNHVIKGRILDSESRPAVGAKVTIVRVQSATEPIDSWLERAKNNPETISIDLQMQEFSQSNLMPLNPEVATFPTNYSASIAPSSLSESPILTNANGEFSIAGIGDDRLVTLRLEGDTIVSTLLQVVTRDMPAVKVPDVVVANRTKKIHGCNFVYASESIQWIEGTIRDKLSRQPINDVLVYVMGSDGLSFIQSRSDKEGRYLLKGLPKDPENSRFGSNGLLVVALPSHESPYFPKASWAQQRLAPQPIRMDIELHRGIWIEGQTTDSRTHGPVSVVVTYHPDMDNPHFAGLDTNLLSRDQESQMQIMRSQPKADGKFRVRGFPGKGTLRVVSVENEMYELFSGYDMQKFKGIQVTIQHPAHALVELNIPEAANSFQVLPVLVSLETTNLHFVDEDGREVTDCFVEGNLPKRYVQVYAGNPLRALGKTYPSSDVEFYLGEGEECDRHLVVQHAERKIGAIVPPEDLARFTSDVSTTIVLRPNATVTGRLVNAKKEGLSGYPTAGFGVIDPEQPHYYLIPQYGTFFESGFVQSRFKTYLSNINPVKLTKDGSFEFSLPAAKGYSLDIPPTLFLRDRDLSPGELLDLGTIDVTADPKNWPTPRSTLIDPAL